MCAGWVSKHPTRLLDVDFRVWVSRAVVGLPKPSIHKELPVVGEGYDHIVIDGPPRVTDLARSAIMASDVVLIPVQPSPYDIGAAEEVVSLVEEASHFKEILKLACMYIIL